MSGHLPLSLATAVLIGGSGVGLLISRRRRWADALWSAAVFLALTVLVGRAVGSPVRPRFEQVLAADRAWQQVVVACWWLAAARNAIGLARLLIVLEHRPRETKMVSDLMAGAIMLAAVLAIVDIVFDVSISGLLATSGVIAIVLGLALQSTLSDVFSGIAVGIERPYRPGDLIWVEGGIEGHVVQVNWRSTRIATVHGDIAVVPNSVIAKARLVNHSLPSTVRGDAIEVKLDTRVMPERCLATLLAAVSSCEVPLASPPPSVARTGLRGDGAVYEIGYSVAASDRLGDARTELYGQVQRHLRHAGIPLAVAGAAVVPALSVPTPAELLENSDLFGAMAAPDRDLLAGRMIAMWLAPGEVLIRQGDPPRALFVLSSGAVQVTGRAPDGAPIVHRMGPGGSLGSLGLITGAPYAATATALTAVEAYRLDDGAIAEAIAARPELMAGLEDLAMRGQAALSSDAAANEDHGLERPEMFLSRMRAFLHRIVGGEAGT